MTHVSPDDSDGVSVPERLIRVVEQQRRLLAKRRRELREYADDRDEREAPTHTPAETRAEADGIDIGVQALDEVLETIEATERGRLD